MTRTSKNQSRGRRALGRGVTAVLIAGFGLTVTLGSGAPAFAEGEVMQRPGLTEVSVDPAAASNVEAMDVSGAVEVVDDGLIRYNAWIHDKLPAGVHEYHAKCPDKWPYLKRFHTGGYDGNRGPDSSPFLPGGVMVYTANGGLAITGHQTDKSYHRGTGPDGYARYTAVNGVKGSYASFGATDMRIVMWCVSNQFNGAVDEPWDVHGPSVAG